MPTRVQWSVFAAIACLGLIVRPGCAADAPVRAPRPDLPPREVVLALRQARIDARRGRLDDAIDRLAKLRTQFPASLELRVALADLEEEAGHAPDKVRAAWLDVLSGLENAAGGPRPGIADLLRDRLPQDRETLQRLVRLVEAWRRTAPRDERVREVHERLLRQLGAREALYASVAASAERSAERSSCFDAMQAAAGAERWEDALRFARCADPGGEAVYVDCGRVRALIELHRYEEALALFTKAARRSRDAWQGNRGLLLELAWRLWDARQGEIAEKFFRELAALHPEDESLARSVLYLFGSPEQIAAARSAESLAVARIDDPRVLVHDAALRIAAGDSAGALPLLERAVLLAPGMSIAHLNLATAAIALERWDLARRSLDIVLKGNPDDEMALYNSGLVAVNQGDFERAVRDLERLLVRQPGAGDAHYFLFKAYQGLGDKAKAGEHLRRYNEHRARAGAGG